MTRPLRERFEEKYTENGDGCWIWTAATVKGYGMIKYQTQMHYAHRVSYELYKGLIPTDLYVLHRCDVRGCVNPDHLFLGTHADNMADMMAKGRSARGVTRGNGAQNGMAKLTAEDALAIYNSKARVKDLAVKYGVAPSNIYQIRAGSTWKSVTCQREKSQ